MKRKQYLYAGLVLYLIFLTAGFAQQRGRGATDELAVKGVISGVKWSEDGTTLFFSNTGKKYEFDLNTSAKNEAGELTEEEKQMMNQFHPRIRLLIHLFCLNTKKK